jgi:protein-L-isoaspartate(D-aspartate) O-methyltransferase
MTEQTFEAMRHAMVSNQLRTTAVNDARVVAVMNEVPRERFVPDDRRAVAYVDSLVPLGSGRFLNSPMATGRMLTEVEIAPGERVLLIGAATGYAAALLAKLGATVIAIDEDARLLAQAEIGCAGDPDVSFVQSPLADGWKAGAPYTAIIVDGAIEAIPSALIEQLAEGGRLAAGLVERGVTRLILGRKAGGGFGYKSFTDAEAAPLPGFGSPPGFKF